jgi:hypothetical protein
MSISPVMAALVQTNLREQEQRDAALRTVICKHLGLPQDDMSSPDKSALAIFKSFCGRHELIAYPARPATVAYFIHEKAGLGIAELLRIVQAISLEHHTLADPTAGGIVAAMLNKIAPIAEPRSWTKEAKVLFRTISYELQRIIAEREAEREKAMRRAQNESAEARKALAAMQQPKQETDNGISKKSAA